MAKTSYAIALGSNRMHGRHGKPDRVVVAAIAALAGLGEVRAVSAIRTTPAMGPAGRSFANAAAILCSRRDPPALLEALKEIERDFGRRPGRRWGPRVLDLDIILWSEGSWAGPGPIIPHPSFRERRFVLDPLCEVIPGWRDPVTGSSLRQLRARQARPRPVDRAVRRS